MKKIIVHAAKSGGTRPPPERSPTRAQWPPSRARSESAGSKAPVVATVVALLVIVLVLVLSAMRSTSGPQKDAPPAPATAAGSAHRQGWDSLGGKTMGEWMKEHSSDNQELRARQERIRKYRSGRQE